MEKEEEKIVPLVGNEKIQYISHDEAKSCIEACINGFYINEKNKKVSLEPALHKSLVNTRAYPPDYVYNFDTKKNLPPVTRKGIISIHNEATTNACYRLVVKEGRAHVCALNFANAFGPGGGFNGGSRAQEETICRSSGLYWSLIQKMEFYQYHRELGSNKASDYIIFSPEVPTWKINRYTTLDKPFNVSYITSAATHLHYEDDVEEVRKIHDQRIRKIVMCCIENGVLNPIFGAFGCGAFHNNPVHIAESFRKALIDENMRVYFDTITFSIIGFSTENIDAFAKAFRCDIIDEPKVPDKMRA